MNSTKETNMSQQDADQARVDAVLNAPAQLREQLITGAEKFLTDMGLELERTSVLRVALQNAIHEIIRLRQELQEATDELAGIDL